MRHEYSVLQQGQSPCIRTTAQLQGLTTTLIHDDASQLQRVVPQRGCSFAPTQDSVTHIVELPAGIGGLSCAALLAHYGLNVTVCEAHYHAGGAAHGFEVDGYKFDAGPSFHAGLSVSPSSNPLKQVLDIVGESIPCKTYDRWIVYNEDGTFPCIAGADGYRANILKQGGPEALRQWEALEREMQPLQAGAGLFPAAGMRGDLGVLLTAGLFGVRAGWTFAQTGLQAGKLTGPFSDVVDKVRSASRHCCCGGNTDRAAAGGPCVSRTPFRDRLRSACVCAGGPAPLLPCIRHASVHGPVS